MSVKQCQVSLLRSAKSGRSNSNCLSHSFGCTDNATADMTRYEVVTARWLVPGEAAVWVTAGCKGAFICNGVNLRCSSAGQLRRYCACSIAKLDGMPSPVQVHMSQSRMRLVEAPLGAPRFVPGSFAETMSPIYSWWNILDAMMHTEDPRNNYQTGYVREIQMMRMVCIHPCPTPFIVLTRPPFAAQVQLVKAARPGSDRVTYCEVGTNGGHSSVAMLLADSRVRACSSTPTSPIYTPVLAAMRSLPFISRCTCMHSTCCNGNTRSGWRAY